MIRLDKRNVAWSTIDNTLCLLSYAENKYIQLNRTAQFIFERIVENDGIVDETDLKAQMIMRYSDAEQSQIGDDVTHFIEWLMESKVLIRG